jgi:regulator of protease activity HflC (stomatin/prohibitin superfamily)
MSSGISAILGTISLLGFLLFLIGVGLVVVAASQGRSVRGGVAIAIIGVLVGLAFQLISRGVIVVQATERAVVFRTLSGELADPRDPGTHIILPVLEEAILYDIAVQNYTMSGTPQEGQVQGNDAVRARTLDGQEVFLDLTVLYSVSDDEQDINTLHRKWFNVSTGRPNYSDGFVRPTSRSIVRDVTSRFTAQGIYGEQRTALAQEAEALLVEAFAEEGLILESLLLRDVTFSGQFTNAIEQAQVAEQDARRAEIRVREVEQEAQQNIARAEGERDAAIERARGEAESIVIRAQAEAEALRLVSEQIAVNPALIQYLYVQNLSDNVNIALVPSGSPFLFDFDSLAAANPDLVAPDTGFEATEFDAQPSTPVPAATPTPTTEAGGN